MGRSAIEPDVENVGDHLVIVGVAVAQELAGIVRIPGIDALIANCGDDPLVHFMVDQQRAGLALDKDGDRDAPGPLAAEHPVGPAFDHRSDAVAALVGDEARVGDSLHRALTERAAVV